MNKSTFSEYKSSTENINIDSIYKGNQEKTQSLNFKGSEKSESK